jgi:pimeloyl-ACP methyl ester carboxylesterase
MRTNITDAKLAQTKEDAEAAVKGAWDRALSSAEAELARSLGLWVYRPAPSDPAVAAESATLWHRIDGGPVLPSHLVLLIHGLDDAGQLWDGAASALTAAGHTPVAFNYRNDQAIARSTDDLAVALKQLRAAGVMEVSIIGHSMGGLLARDVLTRTEFYNSDPAGGAGLPRVRRLIMLGPPNQGSPLAPLRGVMEIRDQFARWLRSDGSNTDAMLGFLVDGRGEAGADLRPGSAFLTDLNARPAPRDLPITIIIGALGDDCRSRIAETLDTEFARRMLGDEAARLRGAVDAAAHTLGDGCVPAASTALPGVSDVVQVDADHRSMICRVEALEVARGWIGKERGVPPAIPVILNRLSGPANPR